MVRAHALAMDRFTDTSIHPLVPEAAVTREPRCSRIHQEVAELFDEMRSPLLRYVLSLGLAMHDGEEVIQDAFLGLFDHLCQGKPRANLRGWLFRVAHNQALKRRQALRNDFVQTGEEIAIHPAAPGPDPEQALAARQRQLRLVAVVRALPEQDRCCLNLRAEGLRYREIADILGISLGAVSISLVRSLARLKRCDGG